MLRSLIDLLEQQRGGLGLAEISRQLQTEPGVLQGMLTLLVQQGRVIEVGPDDQVCTTCPISGRCNLLTGQNVRYVLRRRRLS